MSETDPESKERGSRALGVLLLAAGLMVNPWSVGAWLADDGQVDSGTLRSAILVGQLLCGACGLVWLSRPRVRRLPGAVRRAAVVVVLAAVVAGGHGTGSRAWAEGLERGWIHPAVATPQELCETLPLSEGLFLGVVELESRFESLGRAEARDEDDREIVEWRRLAAESCLQHGRDAEAIDLLSAALERALTVGLGPKVIERLRRELGVAHLRSGEVEHCIDNHNPERCLFPIRNAGVWTDPTGAERAIEQFELVLRDRPDLHDVRWLLNVAHMAAGTYPDGLSAAQLIPESVIESDVALAPFRDVAGAVGLDTFNVLGGAVMDDFDGDGLLDIVTSSYHPCESMLAFRNNGDGTFTDRSTAAGLDDQLGGFNLVQADYDNDGRLDVAVLRGAWMGPVHGRQRNTLLNLGADGVFIDVTEPAGLGDVAYPSQAAAWADADDDGLLDLYIGNEQFAGQLYRNQGDGTFVDAAGRAGVDAIGYTKGVSWGDFDNDGDMDLFESNFGEPNRLYRNDGTGHFADVAPELGVTGADEWRYRRTFTSWFFDYDNDGWLDLFVGSYGAGLSSVAADFLDLPADGARLELYHGDGHGGFVDVSREAGIDDIRLPMGANYGDVDNDGFLDIYLGTGSPPFEILVPNRLYLNRPAVVDDSGDGSGDGRRFIDATTASGLGHLQKGHAIAFGDLDNDGDQDIFAQMGGFYPADAFHNALFENPGHGNHWLTVRLVGVVSNRSAIGARLEVVVEEVGVSRSIRASVGSGGCFGASSLQQEVGLGRAERIVSLEITWPTSGVVQRFEDVAMNAVLEITEGDDALRIVELPRLQLGGHESR